MYLDLPHIQVLANGDCVVKDPAAAIAELIHVLEQEAPSCERGEGGAVFRRSCDGCCDEPSLWVSRESAEAR